MAAPLVSVVMSAYNAADYLRESIESILNQTFTDFEFIIIDDGSTDNTKKIIESYDDNRIVLISRDNKGLIHSLNEGISIAKGKYIARQDADDTADVHRIERQVAKFEEDSSLVLVSTAFDMFTDDVDRPIDVQLWPYRDEDLRSVMSFKNPFGHGSCMFTAASFNEVGGYRGMLYVEDYDLWSRLLEVGEAYQIPEVLYHWRVLSGGITDVHASAQARAAQVVMASVKDPAIKEFKSIMENYRSYAGSNSHFNLIQTFVNDQKRIANSMMKRLRFFKALRQYTNYLRIRWHHNKRRRIMVVRNAFSHDFGGAEMYTFNLAKELVGAGMSPIVVTQVPELMDRARVAGLPVLYSRWDKRQGWGKVYIFGGFKTILWYIKNILLMRVDVLHLNSRDDFIFGSIAGRLLFKRVIWTDHGDLKYIVKRSAAKSLRLLIRYCAKLTQAIMVGSSAEMGQITAECELPKLLLVYNGVSLPDQVSVVKKPSKKIVIGATSRLAEGKGIDDIIAGFAKAKLKDSAELWLVGDGPQRAQYEKLASDLRISSSVRFLGNKRDVWSYLYAFDMYILASHRESFSLALVEAVFVGLPIISTNVGIVGELSEKLNIRLLPIADSNSIADALQDYVKSPNKYKIEISEQRKVVQRYSLHTIIKEEVLPLYAKK